MIPADVLDRSIDHHIGPSMPGSGVEIPALLAVWIDMQDHAGPVSALDAVQRRLVARGYLID